MNVTIPPITDPLGKHWDQPSPSLIEIDGTHALMTEDTLKQLADYSASVPSGVYEGKMWRCKGGNGWYLRWYGTSDRLDRCSCNQREIILA